jgi:Spy/CpxP family protein refolding chaperone
MKTRTQMMLIGLALTGSMVMAQPFGSNHGKMGVGNENTTARKVKMSDEQRESLKKIHDTYGSELKTVQLRIAELRAAQKTLIESSTPDVKAIEKNIDQIVSLEKESASKKMAMHLEVKKQFPDAPLQLRDFSNQHRKEMGNRTPGKNQHAAPMNERGRKMAFEHNKKARKFNGKHNSQLQHNEKVKPTGQKLKMHADIPAQHLALSASTRELRNKLGELQAKQHTLMANANPDMKAIGKNLEQIADLKGNIMKIHAKAQIEMLAKMTPDEKEKFLLAKDKRHATNYAPSHHRSRK